MLRRTFLETALVLPAIAGAGAILSSGGMVRAETPKGKDKVVAGGAARAAPASPLPPAVLETCEGILTAVRSGDIEDLRIVLDWNEISPVLGDHRVDDPIANWKRLSGDGEGREILAILANLLAVGPTQVALGSDLENPAVYVWPYLSELPLDKLTPAQEVDLFRLMAPQAAREIRETKKWAWYRLSIGADGTWHSFMNHA